MKFEAVFFDLFNTLFHFNYFRLPQVEFRGEPLRTTSVEVHRRLEQLFGIGVPYQHFLEEFETSLAIVTKLRNREFREFSCLKRFQILCERLNVKQIGVPELIVEVHMEQMLDIIYFPEEKRAVLEQLVHLPLVLVSNFDHAPTARRALRAQGVEEYFRNIFISDEVGWRKPGEQFFKKVLSGTSFSPKRCLYVGDDPEDDVYGATRQGFRVAWLVEGTPPGNPPLTPYRVIRHLRDVVTIVRD